MKDFVTQIISLISLNNFIEIFYFFERKEKGKKIKLFPVPGLTSGRLKPTVYFVFGFRRDSIDELLLMHCIRTVFIFIFFLLRFARVANLVRHLDFSATSCLPDDFPSRLSASKIKTFGEAASTIVVNQILFLC